MSITLPKYITDSNEIKAITSKLDEVVKEEHNWTTKYINPKDNSIWIKLSIRSENHGGGFPVLTKKENLSVDNLIKALFRLDNIQDIAVAAALLEYLESNYNKDFRKKLIEDLEFYYKNKKFKKDSFELSRLDAIIINTSIFDDTNRRVFVGRFYDEIIEDYMYFKNISIRVDNLLIEHYD